MWPDHPNVVDDYAHDCDPVGPNVVEIDSDPLSPVIFSEEISTIIIKILLLHFNTKHP